MVKLSELQRAEAVRDIPCAGGTAAIAMPQRLVAPVVYLRVPNGMTA